MIVTNKIMQRDFLALLIVLVVAAVMRLQNLEVLAYHQDQADLVTLAQDLAEGKSFPVLGIPSSAGMPNSPVTVYVIAIPYLVSDSPIVAVMFVAILNVIAVGLLWFLVQRYFNTAIAFVAALAYAVNPWAVGFSRDIWAQDYVAPFLLMAILLGLYGFIEGRRWAQVACLPMFLLAAQIHFAVWLLLPLYAWLVWVGRKQVTKGSLLLTAVLGILVLVPFLIGVSHLLTDNAAFAGVQPVRRELSLRELIKPYGQMIWLMTGLGTEQYNAREQAAELIAAVPIPKLLWGLLGATTILGVVVAWMRLHRWLAIFLLIWAFFSLIVFTPPFTAVTPFYFISSIPALCLLSGIGITWIFEKLRDKPLPLYALATVFGLIFLTQGLWTFAATNFIDRNYTSGQFGNGTPIHYLYDAQNQLSQYDDVVIVGSSDWLHITRNGSRVWASLLRNKSTCVRDILVEDNFAVFPSGPFAVAFAPRVSPTPLLSQLYQTDNPTVISLRPGEGDYQINHFDAAPEWPEVSMTAIDPARFDNGITLTGYRWDDNRLYLEWLLPEATTINYQYSVDVLDDTDETLSQQQSHFWQGLNWCAGDRLVSWLDVQAAEDARTLNVTLFRQSRGGTLMSNLLDDAGNTIGVSADIPLNESES